MKNNTAAWVIGIVVVLVVIGAVVFMKKSPSSVPLNSQPASPASSAPMIPATGTVVLNEATSASLGAYLVAANGMTLYQDANDAPGVSNCSGGCATAWPPYTVSSMGALAGGTGVAGTVSMITRADGTMQVTYNGMPLYFWQGDKVSGDATGQNVNGFTVVKP